MEEFDYVVTIPAVVLIDRRATGGAGYVCSRHKGRDFLIVFTDQDLASRYYEGVGKPAWMVFGVMDTPRNLIGFLETAERNGCQYIGFDPTKKNVPQKVLPLKTVLEGARKAFPEN